MNLSDFGVTDCPGGVCRVDFSRPPISEDELKAEVDEFNRRWSLRRGGAYAQANMSFLQAKASPIIDAVGLERAVELIGPEPVGWTLGIEPGLIGIAPMLERWA